MESSQRADWLRPASLAVLAVYWIALFVATHVPRLHPAVVFGSDKVQHAVAFAGLAFLFAAAWSLRGRFAWRQALALLAILAVYAGLDEVTQPLVGRHADWRDSAADVLGAVAGLAAFAIVRAIWRAPS